MQRKGNMIVRGSQAEKFVTVGIDMGGSLWATTLTFWDSRKQPYYKYRDDEKGPKEEKLYRKISDLVRSGYRVHAFYEAGRYGFSPARVITALGGEVTILPVNKLEIVVCGKKVKTDKVDSKFLAGLHPADDIPRVYVPTVDEEAKRGAERELRRLEKCIRRLNAQLIAIIEKSELWTPEKYMDSSSWKKIIVRWRKNGELKKLPELDVLRLRNHIDELKLFEEHLSNWQKTISKYEEKYRLAAHEKNEHTVLDQLMQFRGIADNIARHFDWEIGSFSRFKNGRSFSSYFGLDPTEWSSGKTNREQGISKAGRSSLRKMAIEMAWLWYRWQPECELVKKWLPKLKEKGRSRKTSITALARQLLVALWRYIVRGEEIKGAIINKPLAMN